MVRNETTGEIMDNVDVYDNDGETFDRYTIILNDDLSNALGMSHNPESPQGVNQFVGAVRKEFVMTQRHAESIPDNVFKAVKARLK